MNSLEIKRMEQTIIQYVNSVQLPMECKRLVLREILAQVESASDTEIGEQLSAEKSEKEENENAV